MAKITARRIKNSCGAIMIPCAFLVDRWHWLMIPLIVSVTVAAFIYVSEESSR